MKEKGLQRGQPITFRIPSDTSDHILKHLQKLKEVEKRNFSSKIAEFVLDGVSGSLSKQRETVTIPLPKGLTKEQRDWLKHEHSEALLGSIVYQLLCDPIRTASIFATLNSGALEIDDALYLQEEAAVGEDLDVKWNAENEEEQTEVHIPAFQKDDDLDDLDWDNIKVSPEYADEMEEEEEDPLGDFLAQMNR